MQEIATARSHGATARTLILATVKENVSLTALDPDTGDIVAAVEVGVRGSAKPHELALIAARITNGGFNAGGTMPEALIYCDI